jgi:N-acyl-D-aspartate/D-glutamate deacylase
MEHETIISGGKVVDGTGANARRADVAIDGGRITRIGDLSGGAAGKTIDASGKIVTPGFVDLHTHLDAQAGWDAQMSPSSYHGVTTAGIGNCGMTFAPVRKENKRFLAELMEAVEDISAEAILDGLPWNWESYGEYLDTLESLDPAINIVGLAGHCAIRYEVMGDKSLDYGVQADDRELAKIVDLVKRSIEEGAVGISTSRFKNHIMPDGRMVPGTWANERETRAIQKAIVEAGGRGGLFQAVLDVENRFEIDKKMLEDGAEAGCHVVFSNTARGGDDVSQWKEFLDRNNLDGKKMSSCMHTRPSGSFFGLAQVVFNPTENVLGPNWEEVMSLMTIPERVEAMKQPGVREKLITEGKQLEQFISWAHLLHPLGLDEYPSWDIDHRQTLASIAEADGKHPIEVYVDRMIQSEGRELWNMWAFGSKLEHQWELMRAPQVIPMLGDAGAHVGLFTDADSPTFLLSELARDRDVFTLEEAVHRITAQSAQVLGLKERGEIREGWHADINVIDYDNLKSCHPEFVRDLPLGVGRIVTKSEGYDATLVAGKILIEKGKMIGDSRGEVIRDFVRG